MKIYTMKIKTYGPFLGDLYPSIPDTHIHVCMCVCMSDTYAHTHTYVYDRAEIVNFSKSVILALYWNLASKYFKQS